MHNTFNTKMMSSNDPGLSVKQKAKQFLKVGLKIERFGKKQSQVNRETEVRKSRHETSDGQNSSDSDHTYLIKPVNSGGRI